MNPDPHTRLSLLQTKSKHPTEVFMAAHELVTLLSHYPDPAIGLSEAGGIEFHYKVSVLNVYIDLHVDPLEYIISSVTPHSLISGKPSSVSDIAKSTVEFIDSILNSVLKERLSQTPNTLGLNITVVGSRTT